MEQGVDYHSDGVDDGDDGDDGDGGDGELRNANHR